MSWTPEHTFEETLVKLSSRRFQGGSEGSGTPESRVAIGSPEKQTQNPMQPAGVGAGTDLSVPQADNKYLARSLGSYNRVQRRAPAPAPTGKLVYASVRGRRKKYSKKQIAMAATFGGTAGTLSARALLPLVSRKIRRMPRSRRLLATLGLGVGGAGLGALGAYLVKKYQPKQEKKSE